MMNGSTLTTRSWSIAGLSSAGWWGFFGVIALLVDALIRLAPVAWAPIADESLGWGAGLAYLLSIAFMAYTEGYRGFQKQFTPRLVARLWVIRQTPWWVQLLAPLYAMGMIHATRRRLLGAWGLVLAIVMMIIAIRFLPQPWRGAIDAGVVVGMSWGLASMMAQMARALVSGPPSLDPELPPSA